MQLTYRGQQYITTPPELASTATEETATFLGQTYRRRSVNVAQRQLPAQEYRFLGQRYIR